MNGLKLSFLVTILSILLLNQNALGFGINKRAKRLSGASDINNFFKHDIRLSTQEGTCTGSIISDEYILTAAHCVLKEGTNDFIGIDRQLMIVSAGITALDDPLEFRIIRHVEKIYVPWHYNNPGDFDVLLEKQIGDIVLKLNYRLGLNKDPRIKSLELPTYQFEIGQRNTKKSLWFAGFGHLKSTLDYKTGNYVRGPFPSKLQYSEAEVLDPSECDVLGDPTRKMCAKLINQSEGICAGDSGGALINLEENTVIGVLSYGDTLKCNGTVPGKYTRVFPYHNFIMNAINNVADRAARVQSFKGHDRYEKAFRGDLKYLLTWIYPFDN